MTSIRSWSLDFIADFRSSDKRSCSDIGFLSAGRCVVAENNALPEPVNVAEARTFCIERREVLSHNAIGGSVGT